MNRMLLVVLLVGLSGQVFGDDASDLQKFKQRSAAETKMRIAGIEESIKKTETELRHRTDKSSVERMKRSLANQKATLAELKSNGAMSYLPYKLTVGDLGRFQGKIEQVVNDNNAIALTAAKEPVWIQTDTTGLTDGAKFSSPIVFKVAGTKRYTGVDGATATVLLLKPIDLK